MICMDEPESKRSRKEKSGRDTASCIGNIAKALKWMDDAMLNVTSQSGMQASAATKYHCIKNQENKGKEKVTKIKRMIE